MHIPTIERAGGAGGETTPPMASAPGGVRMEALPAPLAGHVVMGVFLSIITLGIYRFWYRTSLRRYYWGHTRLAGDRFEYTGTGKELFIGFLIAIAIVVPLYLVVTLVGLVGGNILGPVVASLIGAIIMPAVVQILIYRARRYRLLRTWYRGVRFHQTGSGTGYLLRTVKWLLLTGLTLGIVYPYLRRALERYKTEHTWYGSAQGSFSAPVKPLMTLWLLIWGMVFGVMILAALVPVAVAAGSWGGTILLSLLAIVGMFSLPIVWQVYRVREFRIFVGGTRIGDVALASDLAPWPVIWVWISYYLMMLAVLAVVIGGAAFAFAPKVGPMGSEELQQFFSGAMGLVLVYGALFVVMVVGAIISEIFLRRRLWALRARSITVYNLAALEQVIQRATQESLGVGEAFDTGFDIAG